MENSAAEQGQEYEESESVFGDKGNKNPLQPKGTTSGPSSPMTVALLSREKSFLESFASVREMLSSIVKDAKTTKRATDQESNEGIKLTSPVGVKGRTSQGSLGNPKTEQCGARSSQAAERLAHSMSPSCLPPPPQSAETSPGRRTEMRHGKTREEGMVVASSHTDGRDRSLGGGVELSTEFSEILHHYSERLVKVVQVRLDPRFSYGICPSRGLFCK